MVVDKFINISDIYEERILSESITWHGLPLVVSYAAQQEIDKYLIDVYRIIQVLEYGFGCERSRRASGIIERCLIRRGKVLKVVVASQGEYWVVIHVGIFGISKELLRRKRENGDES